ncbi:hypothetical protein A2U01_0015246 [Trifolium medium]|uniref:Uncharacterized protein n=1 Tax=Trifolium medium TaxID=97028 RepID=A0A392N5M9_9FABA|nr:hypothetical protein [Trifolium medium]
MPRRWKDASGCLNDRRGIEEVVWRRRGYYHTTSKQWLHVESGGLDEGGHD